MGSHVIEDKDVIQVCEGEPLPDGYEWAGNRNRNIFDDGYIDAYLANPKAGKTAALRAAGFEGTNIQISQKAQQMHRRLRDVIESRLDEMITDGAAIGYNTLMALTKDADSENVRAACASKLMDYAGRKPGEKLIVSKDISAEERDAEILRLQRKIASDTGERLDS